jgi:hypothetical protein
VNKLDATATLVAVAGTLAGVLLSVLTQAWLARSARREAQTAREEARVEARRDNALAAVTTLANALANHRRAMWMVGVHLLNHADKKLLDEARNHSHDTRAEINIPLVTVEILVPALAPVAHQATQATFALRQPDDLDTLEQRRVDAKAAYERLVAEARTVFADMGVAA